MIKAISELDIGKIVDALNDHNPRDLEIVKVDDGKKGLIYELVRSGYNHGEEHVIHSEFGLYGKEVTVGEIIKSAGGRDNVGKPYLKYCEEGGTLYEEITAEYSSGCVKSEWGEGDYASGFFKELGLLKEAEKVNGYPKVVERDCREGKEYILRDVIGQDDINLKDGEIDPGNIGDRIRHLYLGGKDLMRVRLVLRSFTVELMQDPCAHRTGYTGRKR